jgi:hypothetical protein
MSNARPGDDSDTREELGITFRPAAEAIADGARWLYETGQIGARQARACVATLPS